MIEIHARNQQNVFLDKLKPVTQPKLPPIDLKPEQIPPIGRVTVMKHVPAGNNTWNERLSHLQLLQPQPPPKTSVQEDICIFKKKTFYYFRCLSSASRQESIWMVLITHIKIFPLCKKYKMKTGKA